MSHYSKSKKVYPEPCKSSEAAMTLLSLNNSVVKEPYIIDTMKIKYKQLDHANPGNPTVWGPAMWFSLHNGASKYPKSASLFWKDRMKSFIQGIPVMIPCENCADHACAYIESQSCNLETIVSSRDNLMIFFIDFHNFVNERLGKPIMSREAARKMFNGTADVLTVEWGPT